MHLISQPVLECVGRRFYSILKRNKSNPDWFDKTVHVTAPVFMKNRKKFKEDVEKFCDVFWTHAVRHWYLEKVQELFEGSEHQTD